MCRSSSFEICHASTSLPEREPCPMVGGEPSRGPHDNTPPGRHLLVIFSLCKVVRRRIGSIRHNVEGGWRPPRKKRPKLYHPLVSSELRYFACLGQARVAGSPL